MTTTTTTTTTSPEDSTIDPLGTAILYQSMSHPEQGCGHAVPFSSLQPPPTTTCPVCGTPCAYLVDARADRHHNNWNDHADMMTPPEPTVLFKYGKLVYRLTVPTTTTTAPLPVTTSPEKNHSTHWWKWIVLSGWFGGSSSLESNGHTTIPRTTAQERIRTVLGIRQSHGMKVRMCVRMNGCAVCLRVAFVCL